MMWNLGQPFYILFAQSRYNLTAFWVGAYLASRYAGELCFILLWALLSDRGRNRAVLRGATLLSFIPPVIVFTQLLWGVPEVIFALAFFATGGSVTGHMMGGNNYLLQHAPSEKRPLYIGVMNSTLGLTLLLVGLGGLIVDYFGYPVMFALVALISSFAAVSALKLNLPGSPDRATSEKPHTVYP